MKQTSLLPLCKHTSLKKSPLPQLSKPGTKSPISKAPFQELLSSLSPMVKNAPTIEEDDDQDIQVTPIKPSNASKRRTRDVFDGIPQSFEKRIKHTESTAESENEKIRITFQAKPEAAVKESQESAEKSGMSGQSMEVLKMSPKEQGNNSSIALNHLSPNSKLFKEMNGLPDQIGGSQMKKLLSGSKKAQINFDQALVEETKIENSKPVETESAANKTEGKTVSEKPKISESTLSIISSLKAKKDQNKAASSIESKISETLNIKPMEQNEMQIKIIPAENQSVVAEPFKSPSIREKYEELLRPDRDFVLPYSYKRLLTVFETMDKLINFLGARREASFFSNLRESLKDSVKADIGPVQLAQIMYILPNAYSISWEKNEKQKGDYELYLRFNADENETEATKKVGITQKLEARSANFKKGLLELTKKHHTEFVKKLSPEEAAKNYEQERCWNSKFKVHECPPIPEAKLPSRPHRENLMSVQDFLLTSDVKDKRVKQIMEECLKKQEEKPATVIPVSTPQKNVMGISEKLLAKIRAKEQALVIESQEKQKNQAEQLNSLMKQELKKIAETLKIYFMQRKVASMFLVNVVEHLTKNSNGLVLGKNEAVKYIDELMHLCPEWLSVTEINNNRVLKMEKSLNMQVVYDKLEKKVT